MPVALLERIPVPSLQTYTFLSCSLFTCAVYYAHQIVTDEVGGTILSFIRGYLLGPLGLASTGLQDTMPDELLPEAASNTSITKKPIEGEGYSTDILHVLLTETWCVWTMINMAYCCLILLGKVIQKLVFGKLRVIENQRLKDKFWNFIFYKFIFIFGVMNVQNMDEVICWSAWFTILGFLHLFSQLSKDRFEYLSFSPTTPNWMHVKVTGLLLVIQISCGFLTAICVLVSFHAGANTFAFMVAECLILSLKTLHMIIRYSMHLYDLNHEGVWENRGIYVYYLEFMFEMTILTIDFMHHLHMLVWGNIFLSMASLVICMQLRFLFHEFQRRWKRHKNYLRVVNSMEARFPMATPDELENNNDECAICWEKMQSARKLECGHLFHNACLRSWLEQETSCPICRASLGEPPGVQNPLEGMMGNPEGIPIPPLPVGANAPQPRIIRRPLNTTNHFFHFDASRYISWLPSFSVEVTHTQFNALRNAQPTTGNLVQTSQLDNMVRQVQDIFPNMPAEVILADLRVTHSVEITIENIIEERVTAPPTVIEGADPGASNDESPPVHQGSGDGPESNLQPVDEPTASMSNSASHNMAQAPGGATAAAPSGVLSSGGGINLNLNFFTDENIPGLSSSEDQDDETKSSDEEEHFSLGGRFSKSSSERESILEARKESLLAHARRKFLARRGQTETSESTAHNSKHELDCTEAENETNSLLERNNQSLSLQRESSNQSHTDSESEEEVEEDEDSSQSELLLLNDPDSRRELMLRAVERRLQQQ